jgi:phytoene desaturase
VTRVLVIGAGIGGLAVAARLSALGHDVTVIEKSSYPGGKVSRYQRDGFSFDTGPTLLTLPAVYRDLFLKTAVRRRNASLEDNVGLVAIDPAFAYHWHDGTAAVIPGSNTNRVASALGDALGSKSADEWRAFIRIAADMWSVTRGPFLESPVDGWRTMLPLTRNWSNVRTVRPWSTLRGLGKRCFTDPRLRILLDRYATYTGSDPRRAPATLAVIPYIEQTFGVWHISGGLVKLALALHERCLEREMRFVFDTEVSEVVVRGNSVTGVRTSAGDHFDGDVVVSDVDARHLYGELIGDKKTRAGKRQLPEVTPSLSGFELFLAVRGRSPNAHHHNVWYPSDYDREFDDIFGSSPRPVRQPAIYACVPDDDAMRPDVDHEAWSVLVNAPRHDPRHGVDWSEPALVQDYARQVLRLLEEREDDLKGRVLWSEVRTPHDIEVQTTSPGGAIYGTSTNGRLAALRRPSNRSPVRGLFLTGGSAHPGGGLPLVGMSAAIVADLIGTA